MAAASDNWPCLLRPFSGLRETVLESGAAAAVTELAQGNTVDSKYATRNAGYDSVMVLVVFGTHCVSIPATATEVLVRWNGTLIAEKRNEEQTECPKPC